VRFPSPSLLVLVQALLAAACSGHAASQASADAPPPVARELRGAWVATVKNIDFPSRPGLLPAQLRGELDAIVARAVELQLNALVFQVRPCADALYASRLEPWSEYLTGTQGLAPADGLDPLQYVVARCHAHGLALHAWFNPFRAKHEDSTAPPHASHVRRKAPQVCVPFGKYEWMDPGEPLAVKWSLAVVQDVVQRYDVDGVHVDDYFYPYPQAKVAFPDDASYRRYRDGGGTLARPAWRRQNIDDYVQRLYAVVHDSKPHVAVGISPFGIARPGVPPGIQAGIDQYEQLAADVPKWLREGWLDYLSPQLYWPIDKKPQAFPVLLAWWHTQNPLQRALWPGLNASRALQGDWELARPDELAQQVGLIRGADRRQPGHVHFSFRALRERVPHVAGALQDRVYREPALPPALPWLGATPPPAVTAQLAAGNGEVRWRADAAARFVAVQALGRNGWRTLRVLGADVGACPLPAGTLAAALTPVSRTFVAGPVTRVNAR
jgi:uncharacterized lipoprotein YddW (UPF0748 family)